MYSLNKKTIKLINKHMHSKYGLALESIIIKSQIYVILIVSILFLVINIILVCNTPKKASNCYIEKNWTDGKTLVEINEDKVLTKLLSSSENNVFFHETSCIMDGVIKLNARQACAIESAALMNPDQNVFVLFASQVGFRNTSELPIIDAILSYPNIHINHLNLTKHAENTPLEDWIKTDTLWTSKYKVTHTSDVVRFLSLYKYGGTHIDLDTVLLKSLDTQKPHNFAAAESDVSVNVAILHLEGQSGHEIAEKLLIDLKNKFNGKIWSNNGPHVLTRVLYELCRTNIVETMTEPDRCQDFRVLPIETCYDIKWFEHKMFFEEQFLEQTLDRLKDSLMAHIWNSLNARIPLSKNENAAYIYLAKKFCPKTYDACESF